MKLLVSSEILYVVFGRIFFFSVFLQYSFSPKWTSLNLWFTLAQRAFRVTRYDWDWLISVPGYTLSQAHCQWELLPVSCKSLKPIVRGWWVLNVLNLCWSDWHKEVNFQAVKTNLLNIRTTEEKERMKTAGFCFFCPLFILCIVKDLSQVIAAYYVTNALELTKDLWELLFIELLKLHG